MANLSQGHFAGALADTHEHPIERKIFHAKILVDKSAVKKREKSAKIPVIYNFKEKFGRTEEEVLQQNFEAIKRDIVKLIEFENQQEKSKKNY
jgi:hypothetical protein